MSQTTPEHQSITAASFRVLGFLHNRLWGRIVLGLALAALVLIFKKFAIEHRSGYEEARLWTYEQIQSVLSNQNPTQSPVQIVDISHMPKQSGKKVAVTGIDDNESATSRASLKNLLTKIAQSGARSIGVDVDFSPDDQGNPITLDDAEFLKDCEKLSKETGVPIFFGVDRHAAGPKAEWLGSIEHVGLAAGLGIGNEKVQGPANEMSGHVDEVLRMFSWTKSEPKFIPLPSIAYALATANHPESQELPSGLSWAIEFKSEFAPDPALETVGFLVDYRLLLPLRKTALPYTKVATSPPQTFTGKVVILGVVNLFKDDGRILKRGDDLFRVPSRSGLYSGVLLHGCAVDTLIDSPLREWTLLGGVVADFALALFAIGLVEFAGWFLYGRHGKKHHHFRIHWSVTAVIAVAIGAVAIPFVGTFRLAWDDASFVALGLIAHTGLDHILGNAVHKHEPPSHHETEPPAPIDPTPPEDAPTTP